MVKLNFVDLQFLHLGIKHNGTFDEKDIEHSELKNLGVGRILDHLASLKERKLIEMNSDGSFLVTKNAQHILWDGEIPLWVKILRILEIKSQNIEKIASFLLLSPEQILLEIEDLRKRQLVLMSPLRNERGILKMYEILPEGIDQIRKAEKNGFYNKLKINESQNELFSIIEDAIKEIKEIHEIPDSKKENLISNLLKIKNRLEI